MCITNILASEISRAQEVKGLRDDELFRGMETDGRLSLEELQTGLGRLIGKPLRMRALREMMAMDEQGSRIEWQEFIDRFRAARATQIEADGSRVTKLARRVERRRCLNAMELDKLKEIWLSADGSVQRSIYPSAALNGHSHEPVPSDRA